MLEWRTSLTTELISTDRSSPIPGRKFSCKKKAKNSMQTDNGKHGRKWDSFVIQRQELKNKAKRLLDGLNIQ